MFPLEKHVFCKHLCIETYSLGYISNRRFAHVTIETSTIERPDRLFLLRPSSG